jgi:phosphoglucosamine mutase
MGKLFGTDGIRGIANRDFLTPDFIMRIAVATAQILKNTHGYNHHNKVVIGKDTRLSGYLIESSLTAGFTAAGIDVLMLGPLPTPAISMLTKSMRSDFGIMISASHNPFFDNGLKIFNSDGTKVSCEQQARIEEIALSDKWKNYLVNSVNIGRAKRIDDAKGRYIEFVKNSISRYINFENMKIIVDCAHGAAYNIAPTILWELGAEVIAIGDKPDGFNINDNYGSTNLENLINTVINTKADIGIAFDGDADRVIIIDEFGNIVDGDKIMTLIARFWQKTSNLNNNQVVATTMTNLACEQHLASIGINMLRSEVGDRHVVAKMKEYNANLGGEQSGHIIMSDFSYTGDGIIAALQILSIMVEENKTISEIANVYQPYPQIIHNIKFYGDNPLNNKKTQKQLNELIADYQDNSRIIIRKSGTEPLIRVMVETEDEKLIDEIISQVEVTLNILQNF